MDLVTIGRVLRLRQVLRRHERWDRSRLHDHQQQELSRLRSFTVEHSAFYQRFHAGLADGPLEELPVLTKASEHGAAGGRAELGDRQRHASREGRRRCTHTP